MNGVDTNVIIRLLTGDDPEQSDRARAILKKPDVFVTDSVILESEWVLRHAYGFEKNVIHDAFSKLCGLPNIILPNARRMQTTLQWYAEGMDFADALHLASSQGCRTFYSFDRKFLFKAEGRSPCKVKEP